MPLLPACPSPIGTYWAEAVPVAATGLALEAGFDEIEYSDDESGHLGSQPASRVGH